MVTTVIRSKTTSDGWRTSLEIRKSHATPPSRQLPSAAAEAEAARDELERGRPQWHELGDRITQILTLAEDEAAEIRAQRSREADELLTDARQSAADADRIHSARVREAETQAAQILSVAQAEAEQTMTTAQAEADRVLVRAQQQAAEEERAAARRLAELERQRDAVNAQLSRLHEALAAALAPAISVNDSYEPEPPAAQVSLPDNTGYEPEYEGGYEDDAYAGSGSKDARFLK